jgi:hypothetical protein
MIELTTKADNYAAEKTNEMMTKAIAQAYADGYHDGYKDREEEIPVDIRYKTTEYVDLGLPSGTLWAKEYEKDKQFLFMLHKDAMSYNIPTEEQWKELIDNCKCVRFAKNSIDRGFDFVGPNGNCLRFQETSYMRNQWFRPGEVQFWLKDEEESIEKNGANVFLDKETRKQVKQTRKYFMGYKLPVRLVSKH